jgi:hypothetical protein
MRHARDRAVLLPASTPVHSGHGPGHAPVRDRCTQTSSARVAPSFGTAVCHESSRGCVVVGLGRNVSGTGCNVTHVIDVTHHP